jgi:hypothetical protein
MTNKAVGTDSGSIAAGADLRQTAGRRQAECRHVARGGGGHRGAVAAVFFSAIVVV